MHYLAIAIAALASGCLMSNEITGGWDTSYAECEELYVVVEVDDEGIQDRFDCPTGRFSLSVPANLEDFTLVVDLYRYNFGNRLSSRSVELVDVTGDVDVGLLW